MKIGVSSYSYDQYLNNGKTLFDVIKLAKETGYEGIEFVSIEFPENQEKTAYAKTLNQACQDIGLEVCGYAIHAEFANTDLDAEIKAVKEEIDIAEALGSHTMRMDIMEDFDPPYMTTERVFRRIEGPIRELASYAEEKGIILTTENHSRLFGESKRLEQLISRVDHDNFRILGDMGNFVDPDEDCAQSFTSLIHLIEHVHLKDFHIKDGSEFYPGEGWYVTRGGNYVRGAIIGHGNVPLVNCMKSLVERGYDQWLVVEFEGIEDCVMANVQNLENTKRLIDNISVFKY